jgi:TonB-linked SusC/RagA family outer membrane protein
LKILVGVENKQYYGRNISGKRQGYFTNDPAYRVLSTGSADLQQNYGAAYTRALASLMSQVHYGFKEKYFLTATLRQDGSSVFGPKKRYGWFPSIGAAWRITEEAFLKNSDWLNDLKIRGSWGISGYDGNTSHLNQYTLYGGGPGGSSYDINGTGNSVVQGFRTIRFGNARTGWQKDIVANVGLESILWKGRLAVTIDGYIKRSTGLLFGAALPSVLGFATAPNVNIGNIRNTGVDLLVKYNGKLLKKWNWDATATFTAYKNKIVKLNEVPFYYTDPHIRNEVGHPVSSFYGYKVIGLFQDSEDVAKSPNQLDAAPGRFKYLDANKDGVISDADRVHFGSPNPDFTLGLNIGLTYKNFDFSTFFYGSFGNDLFNVQRWLTDVFSNDFHAPKSKTALYNSWTPQRRDAKAPVAEMSANFSNSGVGNSYALENGTYFRNKSMILGYTFPTDLLQHVKLERLRIYVQAANLFTFTNYSGLDPELFGFSDQFGIDYGLYPNGQKQFLIGINLGF